MENADYKNKNIETKHLNTWYDWLTIFLSL